MSCLPVHPHQSRTALSTAPSGSLSQPSTRLASSAPTSMWKRKDAIWSAGRRRAKASAICSPSHFDSAGTAPRRRSQLLVPQGEWKGDNSERASIPRSRADTHGRRRPGLGSDAPRRSGSTRRVDGRRSWRRGRSRCWPARPSRRRSSPPPPAHSLRNPRRAVMGGVSGVGTGGCCCAQVAMTLV